jgi:predicted SprT family Zn-dependent metalloprotease
VVCLAPCFAAAADAEGKSRHMTGDRKMYRTKQQDAADLSNDDIAADVAKARAAWEAKHPGEVYPDDDDEGDEEDLDLVEYTATAITYRTFNEAYDLFNQSLFEGELPECLITLQRRKSSKGYFGHQKFAHRRGSEIVDEIALNPETFQDRSDREIASTLVHEMTHCWQHHFGKPSRANYHNREWADRMIALGLMPSSTGDPGGKQTGQGMTHYIVDDGAFDREWKLMAEAGFAFLYQDRATNGPERVQKQKARYTCPSCRAFVFWGKPGIVEGMCRTCQTDLVES